MPGGLIDGHKVGIFVEYGERNVLGGGVEGRRLGGLDIDGLAAAQGVGGAGGSAVHAHVFAL